MPDPVINASGFTEIHLAAHQGDLPRVRNCLQAGFDVQTRDNFGYTPLHWVADMGVVDKEREAVAAALIEAGSDVNARNKMGRTALMLACAAGNPDIVRLLLAAGADTSAADNSGFTARDDAVSRPILRLLNAQKQ